MSRMDVLSESEIQDINNNSRLVKKYSELVDRESAYEMLNKKITVIENKLRRKLKRSGMKSRTNGYKTYQSSNTTSAVSKSVIKVLTSATFIRGVFGVLTKYSKIKLFKTSLN
jgi:hypothetical protein